MFCSMGLLGDFLLIVIPMLLISILIEVKKIRMISESSNLVFKELNATMKYLKRKFNESKKSET